MIPPIANNFVAGETVEDAVQYAEQIREARDIHPIINHLGEHYTSEENVQNDVQEYYTLINELYASDILTEPAISVKPSQIGIDINETVFYTYAKQIVEYAVKNNVFVWFDMEDSTTTDTTLDTIHELLADVDCEHQIGVCLQANLHRTSFDICELLGKPIKIRLVKGAYSENEDIAFQTKDKIDDNYEKLVERTFERCDSEPTGIALGSHDEEFIKFTQQLDEKHSHSVEFQMLMGVREPLQDTLAQDHTMYQYIPYGSSWKAYFWRRLREKKGNWKFMLKAIFSN